jgi:hypothetical protein
MIVRRSSCLVSVVRIWPMDLGSWLELAEIHLSKSDFAVSCRKLL